MMAEEGSALQTALFCPVGEGGEEPLPAAS